MLVVWAVSTETVEEGIEGAVEDEVELVLVVKTVVDGAVLLVDVVAPIVVVAAVRPHSTKWEMSFGTTSVSPTDTSNHT